MFCLFLPKKNRKWKPAGLETSFTKHLSQSGGLDFCFSSQFLGCCFLFSNKENKEKINAIVLYLQKGFTKNGSTKKFTLEISIHEVHHGDKGFTQQKMVQPNFTLTWRATLVFLPLHFHPNLRAWRARAAPEFSGRPNGLKNGYSNRRGDLEDIHLSCLMDNGNEISYQSWWFFC